MAQGSTDLSERIARVTAIDPSARAIEFNQRWFSWGELGTTIEAVAERVPSEGAAVGILLRTRPSGVGLLLGVLRAGGCVVAINPDRGIDRTRQDVANLNLSMVAGEPDDLANLSGLDRSPATLATSTLGEPLVISHGQPATRPTAFPGIAVQMLTSGTTGPPKRVDLSYRTLERVLVGAKHYESNRSDELRLRNGVAIMNSPLVHLGGLFRVLQSINDGRSFSMLERFKVADWVGAVSRHRPQTASLVPAALRMVLEANIDPTLLGSVRSVISGTAPLSPDDADAFTQRFGIPVLISYAATEFGGAVAGWNLSDHEKYWSTKRGSVGRAHSGCELRVVNGDTDSILGPGEEGLLEVKPSQLGDDAAWIRTTDIARMDADGFLWILGRADQAIIRGGFKIRPDDVRAALESHPLVRGASVVSLIDPRLGAVPVAAVEMKTGATLRAEELLAHAAKRLSRYELPAEVLFVEELPRTSSGKVDLAAVAALFPADDALGQPAGLPRGR